MDTLLTLLSNPVLNTLSLTLMHFIWQGFGIAATLYFLLRTIDNKRSVLRYNLALAAMLLNCLLPVITFAYLYQPITIANENVIATNSISDLVTRLPASMAPQVFDHHWLSFLSIAWMFGVLYFSVFLIKEVLYTYQLPHTQTEKAPDELQHIFNRQLQQLNVWQPVKLLVSLKVEVPMVIGWLKPVVLLPVNMLTGLNNEQLAMLLAHELAHVRRYDYLVNFLQSLVELLLFFHPCVKWVSKQVRVEREYCCDDIAVQHCHNNLAYANTLVEAELLRPHNIPSLAMAASGGDLQNRIFRMVGQTPCSPNYSSQWFAALSGIAAVSAIAIFSNFLIVTDVTSEPQKIEQPTDGQFAENTPVTSQTEIAIPSSEQKLIPQKSQSVDEQLSSNTTSVITDKASKPELLANRKTTALPTPQATTQTSEVENNRIKTNITARAEAQAIVNDVLSSPTVQLGTEKVETAATEQKNSEQQQATVVEGNQKASQQQTVKNQPEVLPKSEDKPALSQDLASPVTPVVNKQAPEVVKAVPVITQPKVIHVVAPYYPVKAKRKKLAADVPVSFTVGLNGKVSDIVFAPGAHRLFRKEIKDALEGWRFEPGKKDGKPAAIRVKQVFSFTNPSEKPLPVTGSRLT